MGNEGVKNGRGGDARCVAAGRRRTGAGGGDIGMVFAAFAYPGTRCDLYIDDKKDLPIAKGVNFEPGGLHAKSLARLCLLCPALLCLATTPWSGCAHPPVPCYRLACFALPCYSLHQ